MQKTEKKGKMLKNNWSEKGPVGIGQLVGECETVD